MVQKIICEINMKNIHILPTDKPSRLHLIEDVLTFTNEYKNSVCDSEVNIYITNDEIIKEGDWACHTCITNDKYQIIRCNIQNNVSIQEHWNKIILTTDGDLIKDGVIAIDDEFLEWFVKNPSCEGVETIYGLFNPMGRQVDPNNLGQNHSKCIWKHKIIIPQEEPKQETLEEAALNIIPDRSTAGWIDSFGATERIGFIKGAKWQQERIGLMEIELRHTKTLLASCENALEDRDKQDKNKYSEEDLRKAFSAGRTVYNYKGEWEETYSDQMTSSKYEDFIEWFEQFKKK
jgi:hypothetical protein